MPSTGPPSEPEDKGPKVKDEKENGEGKDEKITADEAPCKYGLPPNWPAPPPSPTKEEMNRVSRATLSLKVKRKLREVKEAADKKERSKAKQECYELLCKLRALEEAGRPAVGDSVTAILGGQIKCGHRK